MSEVECDEKRRVLDPLSLGVMLHKIKSPLTIMRGFTEILIDGWDTLTDTQKRAYLDKVQGGVNDLQTIIEDDLQALRDRMTWKCVRSTHNVNELIECIVGDLRSYYPTLRTRRNPNEDGTTTALIDARALGIIIHHLVDNATRYGRKNGDVIVAIGMTTPEQVAISVTNWGSDGRPPLQMAAFSAGWRGDEACEGSTDGLGLGLWIVRNYAISMGGEVYLDQSLDVHGRRTTFTVSVQRIGEKVREEDPDSRRQSVDKELGQGNINNRL